MDAEEKASRGDGQLKAAGDESITDDSGFLSKPLSDWPRNLRKALEMVQQMPSPIQEHIIALWLDQAVPHYRLAMELIEAQRELESLKREIQQVQGSVN